MPQLSAKVLAIFLLFKFRASTQVADIYDILTKDGIQQKREGNQYVVGLYKELPAHALTKNVNIVSMRNKFGTQFTCMVPAQVASDQEDEHSRTEAPSEIEQDSEASTLEQEEIEEEPKEEVVEWQPIEEPVVLDKLTWFLRNYEGPCLKYAGDFWTTKVCFDPIPHIIQQHDTTTFDLGKLNGVFDPENLEHQKLKPLAEVMRRKKQPFLQLAFTGGTDGRISLVNIGCAHIHDRVKKLSEPIELVYVFELSTKLACNYGETSRTQNQAHTNQEQPKSEVSRAVKGSVEEILEKTFSKLVTTGSGKKPCLYYQPGWFTFEICHQKHIQQYRLEHEIVHNKPNTMIPRITQQYNLGIWDEQPITIVKGSTSDKSYAKAVYIDGTVCDLTGEPRKSTIHFRCNQDVKDVKVELFQEVETCVYLFVIATNSMCTHEYFKPEPLSTKEIICYLTNSPSDMVMDEKLETSGNILDTSII